MMAAREKPVRILYSFPHRIGASRICYTAWQQVAGLIEAGAKVVVMPASVEKKLPEGAEVHPTLSMGPLTVSYRLFGSMRVFALHDWVVSARLKKWARQIDVIHLWPVGSLRTLRTAKLSGIPTVLERPNAHTRYAYEAVDNECKRLGVRLPPDHEHAFKRDVLEKEEKEYDLADYILCPSDFVMRTFEYHGFPRQRLLKTMYGVDTRTYYPWPNESQSARPFTMIFVGVCAVRKGVHFALEAWLKSPASRDGVFLIAGEWLPEYRQKLESMLSHPSVKVLGHRNDVPDLLRQSDALVLPSIEEGFGLVCTEAMASGCVPLVSDACTDICQHMENALVHKVGDVATLLEHITLIHSDASLREKLRANALATAPEITWRKAAEKLIQAYRTAIANRVKK